VALGSEITIHYDPIMAKLIVHAPDRQIAIVKMIDALEQYKLLGVKTSRRFMIDVLSHPQFQSGNTFTNFIESHMKSTNGTVDELQRQLAAAVASVVAAKPARNAPAVESRTAAPSPWQTIGGWQIG